MYFLKLWFLFSISLLAACSSNKGIRPIETPVSERQRFEVDLKTVDKFTPGWPDQSQLAAKAVLEKYGDPQEVSHSKLIWYHQGPFKKIILHRESTPHHFPILHDDVLEHVIDYGIKPEKSGDLISYNGSLLIDRTRGELSARCQREEINILSLNLAHDLMNNNISVKDARIQHAKHTFNLINGDPSLYTQGLQFPRQINTQDPDENISPKINWGKQAQEPPQSGPVDLGD